MDKIKIKALLSVLKRFQTGGSGRGRGAVKI